MSAYIKESATREAEQREKQDEKTEQDQGSEQTEQERMTEQDDVRKEILRALMLHVLILRHGMLNL